MLGVIIQFVGDMVTVNRGGMTVIYDPALDAVSIRRERAERSGEDGERRERAEADRERVETLRERAGKPPRKPLAETAFAERPGAKNPNVTTRVPESIDTAALLGRWKKATGLRNSELAAKTGIRQSTICHHCTGVTRPSMEAAGRYARAFGVSAEEFLAGPEGRAAEAKADDGPETADRPEASGDPEPETTPARATRPERTGKKKPPSPSSDPLIGAYCAACQDGGEGSCARCPIQRGLKLAEAQEIPGQITLGVKQGVCARCSGKHLGECGQCHLTAYWEARERYDRGATREEAAREAENNRVQAVKAGK